MIRDSFNRICKRESGVLFRFLFSLLLLITAAIIFCETKGGQVLIHTVPLEISEYRYVAARIRRPLSAQSLDPQPAVAVIGRRMISRFDENETVARFAEMGLATLVPNGYTQGDRQDWIASGTGETTVSEWIQASVDFLRSQPFVVDDGVLLLIDGFSAHELIQFHDSIASADAVCWQPLKSPAAADVERLRDQFGNALTIVPATSSSQEKAKLFETSLARFASAASITANANPKAFISFLLTVFHVVFLAAFLTLFPTQREAADPSGAQPQSDPNRTLAVLVIPVLCGIGFAVLPSWLKRPRFLSDTLILIFALETAALHAWTRFSSPNIVRSDQTASLPFTRFFPAIAWLAIVPAVLFGLTGNGFRLDGIGLSIVNIRQLFTALLYLPVLIIFGRTIQQASAAQSPIRKHLLILIAVSPIMIWLMMSELPPASILRISIGLFLTISAVNSPIVRSGGQKSLHLFAVYAAIVLSSGIMIWN